MEQLEDGLIEARDAVAMLLSSSSSPSSSSSSTAAAAAAAKDANRLLREVERAVQYAQREAMGEPEARKAVILGRLQQVERAARELKGTVRRVLKATAEGTLLPSSNPSSAAEDRDFLLHHHPANSSSSSNSNRRQMEGLIDVVGESREVTASLARTRELMHQEVRRMGGVVEVIDEDGQAITGTHQAHAAIGGALDRADALLRRLQRQEQMDRWSKRASFGMFLLTVAFIAARRVWLPDVLRHYQGVRTHVLLPVVEKVWGGREGGEETTVGVGVGVGGVEKEEQQQPLGRVVKAEGKEEQQQHHHHHQQQQLGTVVGTEEGVRGKGAREEKAQEEAPREGKEKAAEKQEEQEQAEIVAVPAPRPVMEDMVVVGEDGGMRIEEKQEEEGLRIEAKEEKEAQAEVQVEAAHGGQAEHLEEEEEEEHEEEEGYEEEESEEEEEEEEDDEEEEEAEEEETEFVFTMKRFEDKGKEGTREEGSVTAAEEEQEEEGEAREGQGRNEEL